VSTNIEWNGNAVISATEAAMEAGLHDGAEFILEESNRICPIEEAVLIRSGTTAAQGNQAAIGYNTKYAIPQHEHTEWAHDAGRSAKYLEKTVVNNGAEALAVVADRIRRSL
jgi:hypothetical protein